MGIEVIVAPSDVGQALAALADPTRFAVFQCIRGCGGAAGYDTETGYCDADQEGGTALCEVRCRVPCAPNNLTHHLKKLREAGLIETEKRGRTVYARVRPEMLATLSKFFASPGVE